MSHLKSSVSSPKKISCLILTKLPFFQTLLRFFLCLNLMNHHWCCVLEINQSSIVHHMGYKALRGRPAMPKWDEKGLEMDVTSPDTSEDKISLQWEIECGFLDSFPCILDRKEEVSRKRHKSGLCGCNVSEMGCTETVTKHCWTWVKLSRAGQFNRGRKRTKTGRVGRKKRYHDKTSK